ncbi:MAG: hypothetical protein JETT_1745 [Candidatus Jettenia ecosi]|uniref:Uncharacterized protein n=1 Tax=Candidatus Jettenia ecosi TaxID=2494326 RepID=A0A533QB63_9BACT|nr:MAG: hypothetical protein JETT_1745 [Candidatus Jettenia ecosi]
MIIGSIFLVFRYTSLSQYIQKDKLLYILNQLRGHWWGPIAFIFFMESDVLLQSPVHS